MHINTADVSHDVSPMSSPALSRVNSRRSAVSAVSSVDDSPATSPVFSPTYHTEEGTVTTTLSDTATTPSIEHSCNFDSDDWFGRFRDDLDVSDECPDRGTLAAAGEVPLYDAHGNMRPFKTFFTGLDAIGDRQLIIFIRHFYCGVSFAFPLLCPMPLPNDYIGLPSIPSEDCRRDQHALILYDADTYIHSCNWMWLTSSDTALQGRHRLSFSYLCRAVAKAFQDLGHVYECQHWRKTSRIYERNQSPSVAHRTIPSNVENQRQQKIQGRKLVTDWRRVPLPRCTGCLVPSYEELPRSC